jgi:hypothetical protein
VRCFTCTPPKHRFGNLYELLNEAYLKECWSDIRKDAAYGVDRVSARDYEQNLDENIWTGFRELLQRFGVGRPRTVGRPKTRKAALGTSA